MMLVKERTDSNSESGWRQGQTDVQLSELTSAFPVEPAVALNATSGSWIANVSPSEFNFWTLKLKVRISKVLWTLL